MKNTVYIKHPSDVVSLLKNWGTRRQENFLVVTLDAVHKVIKVHHISKGTLCQTIVHPREVFYPVIKDYSASVIFVHNHPSNRVLPSTEDNVLTERLCAAASILGFNVVDHIILTRDGYYSYRENLALPVCDDKINIIKG